MHFSIKWIRYLIAIFMLSTALSTHAASIPENQACFSVSSMGQQITLDASCSTIKGRYHWLLGDGSKATGQTVAHRYKKAGDFTITLRVENSDVRAQTTGKISAVADAILERISNKELKAEKTHVANPYHGADHYLNPDYALAIEQSIAQSDDPKLVAKMRSMQRIPTAIWLDRAAAIDGGGRNNGRASLEQHFLRALSQQQQGTAMVVDLVIYNLPNRDCSALSSNGTLDFRTGGLDRYKSDYIDAIASLTEDPRFASLRFVTMLEPDSLPNMVTNLWHSECAFVKKNEVYLQGIQYAISRFSQHPNNYIFMDIGHSGWLGWGSNLKATVAYFTDVISGVDSKLGMNVVDGFITNISGSTPVEEIFLNEPNLNTGGDPVKSDPFFGWNQHLDEKDFIETLHTTFVQAGFSNSIKFLVDTSRNGWGGENRPTAQSSSNILKEYVDQSRIDRRFHRGNWCNPSGAGVGARPTSEPFGVDHPIAAFVWVKPPGESDGTSNPNQTEADDEGKRYDKMCDPDYVVSHGPSPSQKPTGALANAPASGHWFHDQFVMLISNAYPALKESTEQKPVFPVVPLRLTQRFSSNSTSSE